MNSTTKATHFCSTGTKWLLMLSLLAPASKAVVFYSTADTSYNTTAPGFATGTPSDAGWQWVGYWGSFQGCPIDAHHFIAANHIGGNVGDIFAYQGVNYTTVNTFLDSASDLRIWEVREPLPSWASLYRSSTEVGRTLTVFGRGITRGTEVRTASTSTPANALAGWYWGGYDGRLRWGQNVVAGVATPYAPFGQQLKATFDSNGVTNECHLGIYDSSAPVFINDGTSWKLAGVAGLVDGGFATTSTGSTFNAFIYDERGLFIGSTQITGASAKPSSFYATRISVRISWIDGILTQALTPTVNLIDLNQTYDGNIHPVTATTTPADLTVTLTYNGSSTAPTNAGSYTVVATANGSSSGYSYAGSASGTLSIAKADQTISFGPLTPLTMSDASFDLSATASSGLPVTYTSSNPAVATISGATVTLVGPGATTITADQVGDSNFFGAPSTSQLLEVNGEQASPDNSGNDVPAMPLWATGSLAILLLFISRHFLIPRCYPDTR